MAGDTIQAQTRQALANCEAVLRAGGATLDDVVEVGVLLADPDDFAGMNEAYAEWFPTDPPARYAAKLGAQVPGTARLDPDDRGHHLTRSTARSRLRPTSVAASWLVAVRSPGVGHMDISPDRFVDLDGSGFHHLDRSACDAPTLARWTPRTGSPPTGDGWLTSSTASTRTSSTS